MCSFQTGQWKTNPRRYADVLGCQDKTTGLRCDHKDSRPSTCPESRVWDPAADKYITRIVNSVTGNNGWSSAADWTAQIDTFHQSYKPCATNNDCGGVGNIPGTGDVVGVAIPYDTRAIQCVSNFCSRL